jgi:hypothetical protein
MRAFREPRAKPLARIGRRMRRRDPAGVEAERARFFA